MARGKTIPEDIHWIVVRLGSGTTMTEDEIAMYTDISVRSVRKSSPSSAYWGCLLSPEISSSTVVQNTVRL